MNYDDWTVLGLWELLKERGVRGYSRKRRDELLKMLRHSSSTVPQGPLATLEPQRVPDICIPQDLLLHHLHKLHLQLGLDQIGQDNQNCLGNQRKGIHRPQTWQTAGPADCRSSRPEAQLKHYTSNSQTKTTAASTSSVAIRT